MWGSLRAVFREQTRVAGQDPWIIRVDDQLLLVQSTSNNRRLAVRSFRDLEHLAEFHETVIWSPSGPRTTTADHTHQLWAPELHRIDGRWYVYFAASDGGIRSRRMYVLESAEPLGPYREAGRVFDPRHDLWSIDLTVFLHEGELYGVWSSWEEERLGAFQNLYIARMSNPWTLATERRMISRPTHGWEMTVAPINEGPQVLRNASANKLFIVYSADASWTHAYKMGVLEWNGGDVTDPASWAKLPWPIFTGGGHACFVDTPAGPMTVYGTKTTDDPGWADREIRVTPYTWDELGYPLIGATDEHAPRRERRNRVLRSSVGPQSAAELAQSVPFAPHRRPAVVRHR
jgi:GH43 family beta-xylosidase